MHQEPSLFEKAKMGFIMGGTVGACLGCLIGIYSTLKFGPSARGYLGTIGQYALGSGASFGFFMSIGSCIRNESNDSNQFNGMDRQALAQKYRSTILGSVKPMAYYYKATASEI